MNPALLTPSGLPRANLMAWYDLYDPTTALTSVTDLSGKGGAVSFGSNPAAPDTNDPAWVAGGLGLGFTADDYANTGAIAQPIAVPWNLVVVGLPVSTTEGQIALSFAADINNSVNLRKDSATAGRYNVLTKWQGSTQSSAGNITLSTVAPMVLGFACGADGAVTLTRADALTTAVVAPKVRVGATSVVTLGSLYDGSGTISAATYYEVLLYGCVLTTPELQRVRRYVKAKWAARGVTIL